MIEIWDIYDDDGNKTGRTIERGKKLKRNENHLVVNIYPINEDNQILIQKRLHNLNKWPGFWAATGGSAIKGESSWEACKRELKEELGIEALEKDSFLVKIAKHPHSFCNVWIIKNNTKLSNLILQQEEVEDARWVTIEEIKELISVGKFIEYDYIHWFLENFSYLTSKFFK